MALSLAIGLLIDDAIVVRENIVRHLEHGQDHFTAAREGTSEIGLAVLATSMSIIAVFVPVAFMKGIIGRFFFQFGLTVAFAVLVSLFVSFTLDPMLSSRWHDPDIERKGRRNCWQRALDGFNNWFERMADGYKRVIALGARPPQDRRRRGRRRLRGRPGRVRDPAGGVPAAAWTRASSWSSSRARRASSLAETRGRLEEVLKALGRVQGGRLHLRVDRRGRRRHRARRHGVRQAGGEAASAPPRPRRDPRRAAPAPEGAGHRAVGAGGPGRLPEAAAGRDPGRRHRDAQAVRAAS